MSGKGAYEPMKPERKISADYLEPGTIAITLPGRADSSKAGEIRMRRSGSAAKILRTGAGTVQIERTSSDTRIAVTKKLSSTSMPNIFAVQPLPDAEPVKNAEDALERTGGSSVGGAYSEHMQPLDVIADRYSTHIDCDNVPKSKGLTSIKAKELYEELGPNVLTPPQRVPLWLLFLLQFGNLLMVLLLITAFLCIILFIVDPSTWSNLYLGILLIVVVVVTCYETFSQEAKADSLMEKFRAMVPAQASVLRDGVMSPISATDLVIGDVISLKTGDKVPADCRVIYNQSMKVGWLYLVACSI
jgi:magnesium-transporting ATPase (P-type)